MRSRAVQIRRNLLHAARWLLALALSLGIGVPVAAQGIIIDPPPRPWPIPPRSALEITEYRLTVEIRDQVASVYVQQRWFNRAPHAIEGTFVFPLPSDAAVSDFALWADGKRYSGEVLDAERARSIYEEIVRRQRDPALLEYLGHGLFQARIFPIPPGGERKIELRYEQVLPLEGGLIHFTHPLQIARFSDRPVGRVSVSIELESAAPLRAIYSPSHDVAIVRESERRARVGFEASDVTLDRDFELYFSRADAPIDVSVLSYKPLDEEGYFLLLASPPAFVPEDEVVPKDVVVVLDVSGSMKGEKIDQAKQALKYVLENLQPRDRFNVIAFSTGVRRYARSLVDATEAADAAKWAASLDAVGGTNIYLALLEAFSDLEEDSSRPGIVLFLTDGLPTEGVVDEDRIVRDAVDAAGPRVRLFTFGVGYDVNTVLLDELAQALRGDSLYVRPGERIDEKVSTLYARLSAPVLTDIALDFGELLVSDVYPSPLPDLFAGGQLVIVGRYREGATVDVTLTGRVGGREATHTYEGLTFRREGGEPFIARLWATRKIGYLLSQIRLHGADKELVDEVIALGTRFGIVTPYTSALVQEPVAVEIGGPPVILPLPVPLGRGGAVAPAVDQAAPVLLPALEALPESGMAAVEESIARGALKRAERPAPVVETVRAVRGKTFVWRDGAWVDSAFDAATMTPVKVPFGSEAYFEWLRKKPELAAFWSLGTHVIVVIDGEALEVVEP